MPQWPIEISHPGLKKSDVNTANDKLTAELKALQQKTLWSNDWVAHVRTEIAKAEIRLLQTVLADALGQEANANWDYLKNTDPFPEPPPQAPVFEPPPRAPEPPPEPMPPDESSPYWRLFPRWLGLRKAEYPQRHADWLKQKLQFEAQRERRDANWLKQKLLIEAERTQYMEWLSSWEERRNYYLDERDRSNQHIDEITNRYVSGDLSGLPEPIETFLNRFWEQRQPSALPADCMISLTCNWRVPVKVTIVPDSRTLVIDCSLPPIIDLPTLKEFRYVASRDAFYEVKLRAAEIDRLYDELLYQMCLATLHLVFLFDSLHAIEAAAFNGWVSITDPATGSDSRACISSVSVDRETFAAINLARVEPKACFRALKGVSSTYLHDMVPVAPLVRGDRNDPRFIESKEIVNSVRQGTNLAAIGWEDFEHLIREIFETEFKSAGGEVRVTRASRDWGVDAIAFDPDPIRGGKIVIQAKRYTNTVEVSAVRDLYGTVMNEGAMKGILVTTSTFGPEAYAFAKDKPLTLLDGSNLLHLLERHGRRAYIDLAEAKRLNPTPLARTNLAASSASAEFSEKSDPPH